MLDFIAAVSEEEPGERPSSSQSSWFNRRTNMLSIADHPNKEVLGRLADHEMSHFALHASTPYGLVLDDLCQMQDQLVIGYCHRFRSDIPGEKIPRPIYRFARKYNDLDLLDKHFPKLGVASSLMAWFIHPWSLSRFLENALEADGPASEEQYTDADACAAIAAYESYFLDGEAPWPIQAEPATAERLFHGRAPVSSFAPIVDLERLGLAALPACGRMEFPRSPSIPLGGLDIFEGVAFLLENPQGRRQEIDALLNHSDGQRYMSAWALIMIEYLKIRKIDSQEEYSALVRTFLAICELSLYVAIGPVYGRLRTKATTWPDLQPGYRFRSALRAIKPDEWLCAPDGLDRLQSAICARLGWPAPSQFLKLGAALKPISPFYARHRDACAIRLKHPWAFVRDFEGAAYEKFFKDHCPILAYRGETLPGSASLAAATVRHFTAKLCWKMMFHSGYIWTDDLVPKYTHRDGDCRKTDLTTMLASLTALGPDRFQLVQAI